MRFFRGIAISRAQVDDVIDSIKKTGVRASNGRGPVMVSDLKREYQNPTKWMKLVSCDTLNINETRKTGVETICACGDRDSGLYYACIHNKTAANDVPLLIEFEAPIEDVWVDGRDFLYTVMRFWDRETSSQKQKEEVKRILVDVFGEAVAVYLEEAFKTCDSSRRFALVDLAINDHGIIESHLKNRHWIRGRYGTFFRSAFLVRSPISPSQVNSIEVVKTHFTRPVNFLELSEILG